MPWPATSIVKIRQEFILRALEPGANITELCREHGISRKTAYKWLSRFREAGVEGLEDLSRRPHRSPVRASGEAVLRVLELRQRHARWGPKKLRVVVARGLEADQVPSVRTIARILQRAGEVRPRRRRDAPAVEGEAAETIEEPNALWTVDFKGWWNARDGARCEPLTVRDAASRFVLESQLLEDTGTEAVRARFERLFERHGLPAAIRVDNGPPFSTTRARCGMTTLSAWWVALGVRVIRGRPGHPEDNGGHERMHLDLRFDVEDVGASDLGSQQALLDEWRHEFNHVRPHEALDQAVPADVYRRSTRPYLGPRPTRYPAHLAVRKVASSGRVRYRGAWIRVGQGFRGYEVAVESVTESTVRVRFYELDLGEFSLIEYG